jgi:hypothetical protein
MSGSITTSRSADRKDLFELTSLAEGAPRERAPDASRDDDLLLPRADPFDGVPIASAQSLARKGAPLITLHPTPMNERSGLAGKLLLLFLAVPIILLILILMWIF